MMQFNIIELAKQVGFSTVAPVNMEALQPLKEVTAMCADNLCNNYNKSWSCPPAMLCGSLDAIKEKIAQYDSGVLVQYTAETEDCFDMDAIAKAEKTHSRLMDTIVRQLKLMNVEFMAMGSGGCRRCFKCTYPDRPCRYPEKLHPSMEANGLWVSDICRKSNVKYKYGENTMTFTGCILVKEK